MRGQAKCATEIALSKAATERARVMLDRRDLGSELLAIGVARPWPRGILKPDWCHS